jgi:long-subunit fatty acid transport protein
MKKITIVLASIFLTFSGILAQNVDDALRYSQIFYNGTARFMSMGGAFTAVGGDLSTLTQNPAGLGVFRSSEISITPQLFHSKTTAGFNGSTTDYLYNFNLGQAGIVSKLISSNKETGLVSLNFGYSFNKTNNLNSTVRIQGINNTSSMADYWADISEGTNYNDLSGAAGLAYDAWIIDTITGTNSTSYGTAFNNYGDNIGSVYGQNMRRIITNQGYTGEHAFSIGGNISNKIFFGATLGINRLKYTGHYEHLEKADYVMDAGLKDFTYTEHFENTGTGVSFKIGAIIKPIESIRIGLAFHSPTRYKIDEYFYDNISSNFDGNDSYEFENDPNRYNYALTTPFRAIGGFAVQIRKVAILSADYEYIDYSTAKFSETGDDYDYSEKNLEIKNTLQRTGNLRFGGEFRLNKLYFRGGYGYYGKVFRPGELNEDMHHSSISCGLGFREQNFNVDLGYVNMSNSQDYILYNTFSENVSSSLNTTKNIFMVTLGYKFGY